MLVHRLAFILQRIVRQEVVSHLIGHFAQGARTLLVQLDERKELVCRARLFEKRKQVRIDLFRCQPRQILPVHPQQLLLIKDRRRLVHLGEIEHRCRFLFTEDLAISAG